MRRTLVAAAVALALAAVAAAPASAQDSSLWKVYDSALKGARYVDLTHTITPSIPVWAGFGPSTFGPSINPATGNPYTYKADGFEATRYTLATDQLGTQLDPPAHWAPEYASIDELPATFAVRPLVVISIVPQVRKDFNYSLKVSDIRKWEIDHGTIPAGSVVFVRSDWSKRWTDDPEAAKVLAADPAFPGVSLDALKFLHERRHILFHGHEPLDTDTTPTLEGEAWLMHHGYAQAEGVDHLDAVPATGCLVTMGFPKFRGGLGGYARYIAICPPSETKNGVKISRADAPLKKRSKLLHFDPKAGMRVR